MMTWSRKCWVQVFPQHENRNIAHLTVPQACRRCVMKSRDIQANISLKKKQAKRKQTSLGKWWIRSHAGVVREVPKEVSVFRTSGMWCWKASTTLFPPPSTPPPPWHTHSFSFLCSLTNGWRAHITWALPPVQNKPVPEQVTISAILQLQAQEQDKTYLRTCITFTNVWKHSSQTTCLMN